MIEAISLFLSFRPRARVEIAGLVGLMLVITVTYVGQGLLLAHMVAAVFDGPDLGALAPPLLGVAGLQVLRVVAVVARDGWAPVVSGRVKDAVREQLTLKLAELGPGQTQRMRTGDLQSTVVDATELLDPLIGRFLPTLWASVLGACLAGAWVVAVDPVVGVLVLFCAMLAPLSKLAGARWIRERGNAWRASYRALLADNLDAVQGMATLKSFNASGRRGRELETQSAGFCRDSINLMWTWCASSSVGDLVVPIGTTIAIALGAWHAASGEISIAGLFVILMLTRETFRPMEQLNEAYHAGYSAVPAARSVAELLSMKPHVQEPTRPAALPAGRPGIEFEDVRFAYPTREEPALDRFTLSIAPGERVAVVGRSGAGKSTTLALLMRHFDPDSGTVRLGGRDLRDLPLAEVRTSIGVVAQDTYLFHGTVRDNLLLAKPEATDAELRQALEASRAAAYVDRLPDGADTVIGERGLKLSGGERQRLAIARALLKDAPVLVLDEPTSAIDAANEAQITRALAELTAGRTTLVIAHRLSTVRDADRIVVMDAGRVVESGTHTELLAREGAYAELVTAQTDQIAGVA